MALLGLLSNRVSAALTIAPPGRRVEHGPRRWRSGQGRPTAGPRDREAPLTRAAERRGIWPAGRDNAADGCRVPAAAPSARPFPARCPVAGSADGPDSVPRLSNGSALRSGYCARVTGGGSSGVSGVFLGPVSVLGRCWTCWRPLVASASRSLFRIQLLVGSPLAVVVAACVRWLVQERRRPFRGRQR
jgi:hypothetical protein